MRRWFFALAALLLLPALALGLAANNLGAFVAANRDAIAKRVAAQLGREVSFGEVGVSLRGGLAVRVADLSVADDPAFSAEPFLRVGSLEVQIRILPALRGRIEAERVVLHSPEITVVRTAQGLSTASLGRGPADPAPPNQPGEPAAAKALLVALVDVENGSVRFVDRRSRPPVESALAQLEFRASDVTPGAPVDFELAAAVLGSARPNLRASGRVDPAAEPRVDVRVELSPLDLAAALASAPLAGGVPKGLDAAGPARLELLAKGTAADLALEASLDARDAQLRLGDGFAKPRGTPLALSFSGRRGAKGLEISDGALVLGETRLALAGAVEDLASPRVRLRIRSQALRPASFGVAGADDVLRDLALDAQISFPSSGSKLAASLRSPAGALRGVEYADLALEARMERGRFELSKLSLASWGGELSVTGSADLRAPGAPTFAARVGVVGARVESLIAAGADASPPRVTGRLDAELAVRGAGASREQIAASLVGSGKLGVADGVLRGFNPAGEALRALVCLPVLSERKLVRLYDSHPQVFGAEDTTFERIDALVEVAGGEVAARDARLVARDYDVKGEGRYAFAGRIDSSAVMAFSRELSDAAVDAEKKLRFLRSPQGRVEFPVVIRGEPGDLDVKPDLAYVAGSISREALGSVVERALVGERRPADPGSGAEPTDESPPEPPASLGDAGRELLRRGLGGLLGGQRQE